MAGGSPSGSTHALSGKTDSKPMVVVVDDDEGLRTSLIDVLRSVGVEAVGYGSTAPLLDGSLPAQAACIILDIRLPGISGLDFQDKLQASGIHLPIIFMTGFGDVPMSVRAMKAGALDFLTKPFRDQEIIDAVSLAIERDTERRQQLAQRRNLEMLVATLTPRESEVMGHVIAGLLNKQIAFELGLSEITVKIHRGNLMRKMKCNSVAELVLKTEPLRQI
ncbi:Nodulation protein W [Martelella endophytica]|uniref:Nodulation protein W n=1 Tax=Martelella endophytica TaxID=1486262 RepID=A0A0D5LWC1_MAREN|nr:Nodulation protein W [Martelella endophytica]